jgi:hypothetical protein
MAEAFRAMAISGGILLGVLVITILISVAAVNRGSEALQHAAKHHRR